MTLQELADQIKKLLDDGIKGDSIVMINDDFKGQKIDSIWAYTESPDIKSVWIN